MFKTLEQLENEGIIQLGRGNIISKDDIKNNPGTFPIYSSSAQGNGEFGRYGDYMFDDERITWSIDGGGKFFYRNAHKYSVTNVCGWLKVLRPDVINTKYLYYALFYQWQYLTFDYTYKAHPSVIRQKYTIKIPLIDQQMKIVAILDQICNVIDEKNKQFPLYNELVKSRFIEMFENGSFSVFRLGDMCLKITDGTHKTPNYLDAGITFVSAKNIVNGELDFSDVKYISEQEYVEIQKRCQTEMGDILLSKSGSLGSPVIVKTEEKIGLFESLAVIKYDRSKLLPEFLCEQLKADRIQKQFKEGTKGVAIKHLHLGVIANIDIIVPPLELQNQFAAFVEQTDKSKYHDVIHSELGVAA